MRSPLAYPLARSADTDAGGAADLQTDIMRFMAILALCLVAVFALVQSLPLAPVPQAVPETDPKPEPARAVASPPATTTEPAGEAEIEPRGLAAESIVLTRQPPRPAPQPPVTSTPAAEPPLKPDTPAATSTGFTLAFESDRALAQLVAAGRVGLYAIDDSGAWRMAVSNSRISFWDASTPNEFYEMESATVPQPVVDALAASGADAAAVAWGVTLPASMRRELESLLEAGTGGDLRIHADGNITLEERP